jgi:hypothetical protein
VEQKFLSLLNERSEPYHRARVLAPIATHSSDWLHDMPISPCGLCLSDEAVLITVNLLIRYRGVSSTSVRSVRCQSQYARFSYLILQAQSGESGESATSSLHKRLGLACNGKSRHSIHQRALLSGHIRWQSTGRPDSNPVVVGSQCNLGRDGH